MNRNRRKIRTFYKHFAFQKIGCWVHCFILFLVSYLQEERTYVLFKIISTILSKKKIFFHKYILQVGVS